MGRGDEAFSHFSVAGYDGHNASRVGKELIFVNRFIVVNNEVHRKYRGIINNVFIRTCT